MSGRRPKDPNLSVLELKEENSPEIISWSEDEKLIKLYSKYNEEKGNVVEFLESEPVEISQDESENMAMGNNDNEFDNEVKILLQLDAIKKETNIENAAAEELSYDSPSPVQLETIQQEEIHIKSEDDEKQKLNKKKYHEKESSDDTFQESAPAEISGDKKENLNNRNIDESDNDVKVKMESDAIKTESGTENRTVEEFETSLQSEIIKQEEVQIKCEEDEKEKRNKKTKLGNQVALHQCPECPYSTNRKDCLKSHSLKHKKQDEVDWYSCQQCPYKTFRKNSLKAHADGHNNLMLKCPKCSYETLRASSLKKHQINHKNKWHACLLCAFKTYNRGTLRSHYLRRHNTDTHCNPKEISIFKCTECSYESESKYKMKYHRLIHDSNNWLQCSDCAYKTPYKNRLNTHQLIHNRSNSFQCSDCSYRTPYKESLKTHLMRHRGESAQGWHRCPECPYKATSGFVLRRHVILHKTADEIQWFGCSKCSFKTAYKDYLTRHQLKHKEAHEIEWFFCYECSFKTKRKPNLVNHISKHKETN